MAVEKGDKLKVEYTGKLDDGTVFDSSDKQGQPLEFVLGQDRLIEGFESALEGMKEGEEKDITIEPENAYGERDEKLIQTIPRTQLPEGTEIEVGMVLGMQLENGQQIPATVTQVDEEEMTVDLNHPLAGKTLHFQIKVLDVA